MTIYAAKYRTFSRIRGLTRQRTAFCLKLLPVCEEAFEMYDLTDDFESSPSYKNLLLELTGLIQTHIELHGIQ